IPRGMTVRVVHMLEAIQIHKHDAQRPTAGHRAVEFPAQNLIEMTTVEYARERITSVLVLQGRGAGLQLFGGFLERAHLVERLQAAEGQQLARLLEDRCRGIGFEDRRVEEPLYFGNLVD